MSPSRYGIGWLAGADVAFLAAVAYALVVVLGGSGGAGYGLACLLLAAAGLFALLGWWGDRSRFLLAHQESEKQRERLAVGTSEREAELGGTRDELARVRSERDGLRQEKVRLESNLKSREDELERERYLRSRSQEAREAQRGWNRTLQAEVIRMHQEIGTLGDPGDVPTMVLRLAKSLLGAEKGLLLSREDEDSL